MAITPPPQNRADPSPSTRLKPSTYPKRRTAAVNLAMAGVMDEPQIAEDVRAPLLLRHHMVDVERLAILKRLVTDGTEPLLPPSEWLMALRHSVESGAPLSPIGLQGRVIGGIGLWDQPMTDNPRPGEFPEGGMALLIHEDPAVPPGSQGPAPVLLSSPPA